MVPVIRFARKQAKCYRKGRGGEPIQAIILHSTDGHCTGDIATLTGDSRKVSVHWYATKDGHIWHFVDDADTAYHAGVVDGTSHNNQHTLGIEQEHIDGQEKWPTVQVQAVAQLVAALKQKHGPDLPVLSHAGVARPKGRKVDPVAYPWPLFQQFLQSAMAVTWTFAEEGA